MGKPWGVPCYLRNDLLDDGDPRFDVFHERSRFVSDLVQQLGRFFFQKSVKTRFDLTFPCQNLFFLVENLLLGMLKKGFEVSLRGSGTFQSLSYVSVPFGGRLGGGFNGDLCFFDHVLSL